MPSDPRYAAVRTAPTVLARAAGAGAIALAALLGAAGCDLLRDPTAVDHIDRSVAVHAIAWALNDTMRVLVTRPAASPAPGQFPVGRVTGAEVRVAGPAGSARLTEAAGAFGPCLVGGFVDPDEEPSSTREGCYTGRLPAPVVPGARYTLLAVLPSGDTVHGAAVAPELPELIEPAQGTRLVLSDNGQADFDVRWRAGQGTALVYTTLADAIAFVDGKVPAGSFCGADWASDRAGAGVDHTHVVILFIECFTPEEDDGTVQPRRLAWDSVRVQLRITAFDTAYARFINEIHDESVTRGEAGAGLTGAAGVFTGAAVAERFLTVVNSEG